MPKKELFFLKNGKSLKHTVTLWVSNATSSGKDSVTTLFDTIETPHKITFTQDLKNTVYKIKSNLAFHICNMKPVNIWLSTSVITFMLLAITFVITPWKMQPTQQDKYSIYASTPLTLRDMNYSVYTRDARAQKINSVFKQYKCPMEGLGEVFVYEADKYNIPYWLVAAVSFQESTCGKKTPEPSGLESYNAWGWGVYGDNVQGFDNWVRGIETVSEYMSERFYSKGVTEPCEIMKTYTPPSKGSWCEGVKYFGQQIQDFTSSDAL